MKKVMLAVIAALMVFAFVSCSTTKASDIPPRTHVVKPEPVDGITYDADTMWKILDAIIEEDTDEAVKDASSKTIVMKNVELGGNVGFAAQDGTYIVDVLFKAEDGQASVTVTFVDAYTTMYLGPVAKKVHMGVTDLGMKEYDYQVQWLFDAYENSINYGASAIGLGVI